MNTPMEASYFAKNYWGNGSSHNSVRNQPSSQGGRNSKLFNSVFTKNKSLDGSKSASSLVGSTISGSMNSGNSPCMLVARLIRGAGMTRDDSAVNVFVQLELYDPPMVRSIMSYQTLSFFFAHAHKFFIEFNRPKVNCLHIFQSSSHFLFSILPTSSFQTPPGFEDDPYSAGDIRRAVQVDKQVSTVRLWTKRPNWNHAFEMGPVASPR